MLSNASGHESTMEMSNTALLGGKRTFVYCLQDVLVRYLHQLKQHLLKQTVIAEVLKQGDNRM